MRKSISRNQWIMDVVGTVLIGIPVLLWTLHGAFPWGTNTAWTQEVGGPNGNVVSTENAADAEPSESPATEATLATLPSSEGSPEAADLITRMMEIPYVGTSTGRAISLQESLQGIRDQEGTRRVVRAYWRTLESICRFRTLAEHAERLRRFRPQPNDLAMIQYLRNDVEKQVRLASDTLYRDQMTLLGSMVSTKQVSRGNRTTTEEITNAALPLPSDTPLAGGYETLFDRFYRNSRGTLSARARLLHYLLPLHREAIERRAEQVAAAEYVLQDAVDAYTNGQTSVQTLLWATNESLRSREEFITSVFNYNHDIADYIFMVAPEMTGTAIVPRLIRSQTLGTSNRLGLNLRSDGTISLPPSRFDATPHTVAKPVDAANPNDMADAAKSTETVHPDEAAKLTSVANPTETNKPTEAAKLTGTAALPSESVAGPLMESAHAAAKPNAQASEPKPSEPAKPLVPASSPIFAEEVAPRLSLPESIEPSKTDNEAEVPAAKTETAEESSELPAAETGEPSTNSESDTEDTENGVSYCPSVPVWLTAMQEELLPPALSETPPALSETPPASSETPPASSETPPALGETPPALGETPPALGETPPALGETPPALGETPPASSETPPASSETPPALGETPPALPAAGDMANPTGVNPASSPTVANPDAVANGPLSPTMTPELLDTVANQSQLYAALSSVTPGVRSKELAISLHQPVPVPIPEGVTGTAASLSLLAAVEMSPKDQRGVTGAYWLVALRSAQYRVKLQQQAWITTLSNQMVQLLVNSSSDPAAAAGGDPGVVLRLHLAKATVAADLIESQIRLWDAQFQLTQRLGLPVDAAWPITATVPHHGPFEMFTDQQPETLVQSELGRRLVEIIPGRYEYLVTLGDTVVETDASRAAAMSAAMQDPTMLNRALEAISDQVTATSVFLEAIYGYNRAIADYGALVLPTNLTAQEWVQTLVVTVE